MPNWKVVDIYGINTWWGKALQVLYTSLMSYGVVSFITHPLPAFLVMLATFYHPLVGACGLFGCIISNLVARWMGANIYAWRTGVFGVSGLLIGLALAMYTTVSYATILTIFVGASSVGVISTFLGAALAKYDLPILSLPMMMMIWPLLLAAGVNKLDTNTFPAIEFLRSIDIWLFHNLPIGLFEFVKMYGNILFQENLISGIIVLVAIGLISRVSFFYGLWGGLLGMTTYYLIHGSLDGFHGLNFVLTALAFGGFFVVNSRHSFIFASLAIVTVGLVDYATVFFLNPPSTISTENIPSTIMNSSASRLPSLVFAFNIVTLAFLYPLKISQLTNTTSRLLSVPLSVLNKPESNSRWARRWMSNRYVQRTLLSLPFYGKWTVLQGNDGEWTHKADGRFAWDFIVRDENGNQFKNDGSKLEDYFCYGLPVLSPAAGTIIAIENEVEDNEPGKSVTERNWGNYIIIDHGNGEFSEISHFKKGSIIVASGQTVFRGQMLGHCGNSGRSPVPHIHFQLQSEMRPGGYSLPAKFADGQVNNKTVVNFNPIKDDLVSNLDLEMEDNWTLLGKESERWTFSCKLGLRSFTERLTFTTDYWGLPVIQSGNHFTWYLHDKPNFIQIIPDFKTFSSMLSPSSWLEIVGEGLILPKKLIVGFEWENGKIHSHEGNIWLVETNGRMVYINQYTGTIEKVIMANNPKFHFELKDLAKPE